MPQSDYYSQTDQIKLQGIWPPANELDEVKRTWKWKCYGCGLNGSWAFPSTLLILSLLFFGWIDPQCDVVQRLWLWLCHSHYGGRVVKLKSIVKQWSEWGRNKKSGHLKIKPFAITTTTKPPSQPQSVQWIWPGCGRRYRTMRSHPLRWPRCGIQTRIHRVSIHPRFSCVLFQPPPPKWWVDANRIWLEIGLHCHRAADAPAPSDVGAQLGLAAVNRNRNVVTGWSPLHRYAILFNEANIF